MNNQNNLIEPIYYQPRSIQDIVSLNSLFFGDLPNYPIQCLELRQKPYTNEISVIIKYFNNQIIIKEFNMYMNQTRIIDIPSYENMPIYFPDLRDNTIAYLRTNHNLTQDEIAFYLGISQSTVSTVLKRLNLK